MKMKIGMVDLVNYGWNSRTTRKVLILEEYDTQCLVLWGKIVTKIGNYEITKNSDLIEKERIYNIKEKDISKFRLWCYKYWDNNF